MRSRAAASMLATLGFTNVSSMEGGINAWEGLRAAGPPETGMAHFPDGASPEVLLALAWLLEEGSRRFYAELSGSVDDKEAQKLFGDLATAEKHHEESLANLYTKLSGKEAKADFHRALIPNGTSEDIMEGGMSVTEGLSWAKGKGVRDVLELAISLEANAYDLYIKMDRNMGENAKARDVFSMLMLEEKQHLSRLASLLDRKL
ncbi:MAG TPA: hypothetical protein DCS42_04475 [Nitrospiraceae bacterium]|jgi:sulfur-carrier protein adenylyltransferase/sulfurtransferase|nr:hypothetical protein [Nitrospiraceae bacterium]HAS53430.1 hypothetical protein [Nitrospiraceae bacterium]